MKVLLRAVVTLMSMRKLEEVLTSEVFVRIHRSFILNLDKINSIEGNIIHIGKHLLPLSKGQQERFREMIKKRTLGG